MTSRRFLLTTTGIALVLAAMFATFNLIQDDFGLFWSDGEKRVWTKEKTSKHLMSYRYIPKNFEGLLMGPSYSDSFMDTKKIEGYKIYNMSMDGANSTELRWVAVNAIERGQMKFIVICLTPYATKDYGIKGSEINKKEYWGSLFSLLPIEIFKAKMNAPRRVNPYVNAWGMSTLAERPNWTWKYFVDVFSKGEVYRTPVDPRGLQELKTIVDTAHAKNVRVFAYFFPYYHWITDRTEPAEWNHYVQSTLSVFDSSKDVVWDMEEPRYDSLRRDPACYTDSHLSVAGANLVLADIERVLDFHLNGDTQPFPLDAAEQYACYGKPGAGSGYDGPPSGS